MFNCAHCDKEIGLKADPNTGQLKADTVYWYGEYTDNIFFCDAYCATAAHEKGYQSLYRLKIK